MNLETMGIKLECSGISWEVHAQTKIMVHVLCCGRPGLVAGIVTEGSLNQKAVSLVVVFELSDFCPHPAEISGLNYYRSK